MGFSGKVTEAILVPQGEFNARLVGIETTEGLYGIMVRTDYELSGEGVDGERVSGLSSCVIDERSKLGKWAAALLGRKLEVGEELTIDDLLGKTCRVQVEHRPNGDGKVFANAINVLPSIPAEQ